MDVSFEREWCGELAFQRTNRLAPGKRQTFTARPQIAGICRVQSLGAPGLELEGLSVRTYDGRRRAPALALVERAIPVKPGDELELSAVNPTTSPLWCEPFLIVRATKEWKGAECLCGTTPGPSIRRAGTSDGCSLLFRASVKRPFSPHRLIVAVENNDRGHELVRVAELRFGYVSQFAQACPINAAHFSAASSPRVRIGTVDPGMIVTLHIESGLLKEAGVRARLEGEYLP